MRRKKTKQKSSHPHKSIFSAEIQAIKLISSDKSPIKRKLYLRETLVRVLLLCDTGARVAVGVGKEEGKEERVKKRARSWRANLCFLYFSCPVVLLLLSLLFFSKRTQHFTPVGKEEEKERVRGREKSFNTIIIIFPAPPRNRLVFEVVIATDVFLRCRRRFFGARLRLQQPPHGAVTPLSPQGSPKVPRGYPGANLRKAAFV